MKNSRLFNISLFVFSFLIFESCNVIDDIKKELYVKISTDNASNVSYTIAVVGGNISDDGGKPITERGICYSISPSPTTNNEKVLLGGGIGAFQAPILNLKDNTTYYVRAYCVNGYGTSYGDEKSFKTKQAGLPSVTTYPATNIQSNRVTVSLNVSNDGGSTLFWSGFRYSLNPNISLVDPMVAIPNSYFINTKYETTITGLKENTTYYIAAFSLNAKGESLGNTITVKTLESPLKQGLKNNLHVFYPFDGNANDASGNQFHGIVNNAKLTIDRYGVSNSAYSFDGQQGTNITTNYPGILGTETRSFSFWIKRTEVVWNGTAIFAYGNQNDWGQGMSASLGRIDQNSIIILDNLASASGPFFELIGDKWHHFVIVWDKSFGPTPTSAKFYIDGVQRPSASWTYNPISINTVKGTNLSIGQFNVLNDQKNFLGSIDDFGIWNRVLTDAEIQYLYQNSYKP